MRAVVPFSFTRSLFFLSSLMYTQKPHCFAAPCLTLLASSYSHYSERPSRLLPFRSRTGTRAHTPDKERNRLPSHSSLARYYDVASILDTPQFSPGFAAISLPRIGPFPPHRKHHWRRKPPTRSRPSGQYRTVNRYVALAPRNRAPFATPLSSSRKKGCWLVITKAHTRRRRRRRATTMMFHHFFAF